VLLNPKSNLWRRVWIYGFGFIIFLDASVQRTAVRKLTYGEKQGRYHGDRDEKKILEELRMPYDMEPGRSRGRKNPLAQTTMTTLHVINRK
jgi:hypothetical protein